MPLEIRQDTHFSCSHNISFFVVKHQTTFTFIRLLQKNGPILAWCFALLEKKVKAKVCLLDSHLWRPRGGFWRGPCQEFSGGGGDLMFWEKISLLLLTIFEYTSSLGKYHSLLSALGFEICWRKKWKASRSRLEFQDSMMKILDLVSNYEIQWWKISISSRNMRFNDEKSRSRKSRSRTTW